MYETGEFAASRIRETVVVYDGLPVYVQAVDQKKQNDPSSIDVAFLSLPLGEKSKTQIVNLHDKKLKLKGFRLGFFNGMEQYSFYMSRLPNRHPRQGLCSNNVTIQPIQNTPIDYYGMEKRISFSTALKLPGFVEMFQDKYPSMEEALEVVQKGRLSLAFNKSCCLSLGKLGMIYLYHKNEEVAYLNGKNWKTTSDYTYLQEEMEEYGIKLQV